jgi:hypothetical protein
MVLGLTLQAAGLAWIALIATPGVGYTELGIALTVAGTGTSFTFPTVANAVLGSVPVHEAGVASGTNSALRELGGVLGVSVLASVFARHGVYGSPAEFVDGFTSAVWVGVGFSAAGIVAALLAADRRRAADAPAVARPAVAASGDFT